MDRRRRLEGWLALGLATILSGCATANPWAEHAARAQAKEARMDPSAVCPVVVSNRTPTTLDMSYEVVGMSFDLGLLPSGQSAQFKVQCQAGRVRAMAVSHSLGVDEPQTRFQKMARLDLSEVTHLRLTQADKVH